MKTLNLNKTALLLITLLSISTVVFGNANTKEKEKRVKAQKETYDVMETETDIFYYNVNDPFENVEQGEWRGSTLYPQPLMLREKDEATLRAELKKRLKPYIYSSYDEWDEISITLYCNLKGDIKYMTFGFPIKMKKMPITLIEELEKFIFTLKADVKITDGNRHQKYLKSYFYMRIKNIAN